MRHEFRIDEPLVRSGAFPIESKFLPFWKGFEFIGEAFPQLVLAIVFTANNYDFMNRTTTTLVCLKEFEATLILFSHLALLEWDFTQLLQFI